MPNLHMNRDQLQSAINSGQTQFFHVSFAEEDLSGMDLSGLTFTGSSFRLCNLIDTNFHNSILKGVNWTGAFRTMRQIHKITT